jgi:hypothetical protein
MEKDEMIKKVLGGLLIGGILLGGGGFALAANDNTSASSQSSAIAPIHGTRMPGMGKMKPESMQSVLDSLVSAGTLTQAQADAILAQEKARETERQVQMEKMQSMTQAERKTYCQDDKYAGGVDLFTQLVNDGTINQAQADAIQSANRAKMQTQRQGVLSESLNALVAQDVITNDQASAIQIQLDKFESSRTAEMQAGQGRNAQERQARMETMQSMTQAERQAYREANRPQIVNPLSELVTAGTLTQAQADQVAQAIPLMQGGIGMHHVPGNRGGGMRGPGPQATVHK